MNQKKVKIGLRKVSSHSLSEKSKQKLAEMLHKASEENTNKFTKLVERQARKQAEKITREETYKAQPPIEYGSWKWERSSPRKEQ